MQEKWQFHILLGVERCKSSNPRENVFHFANGTCEVVLPRYHGSEWMIVCSAPSIQSFPEALSWPQLCVITRTVFFHYFVSLPKRLGCVHWLHVQLDSCKHDWLAKLFRIVHKFFSACDGMRDHLSIQLWPVLYFMHMQSWQVLPPKESDYQMCQPLKWNNQGRRSQCHGRI